MRASRSSSRSASFSTSSGICAASIFSRSSSISFVWSSPSPSSFWIAFICSRRKYSRWFLPTSDCTCDWIFDPSSRTSSSLIRIRFSVSMRARTSSVSSTSCFTGVAMVLRLDAMKSARRPGSVMFSASVCRSSESSGDSETTFWKLLLMLRCSASISRRSSSLSSSGVALTWARRYGRTATMSSRRMRASPWTIRRRLPSGQPEHLVDVRGRANRVQVLLVRFVERGVALREHADDLARIDGLVDQPDGALARNRQRHERIGEQHRVAQRQQRELWRDRERPFAARPLRESGSRPDRPWSDPP